MRLAAARRAGGKPAPILIRTGPTTTPLPSRRPDNPQPPPGRPSSAPCFDWAAAAALGGSKHLSSETIRLVLDLRAPPRPPSTRPPACIAQAAGGRVESAARAWWAALRPPPFAFISLTTPPRQPTRRLSAGQRTRAKSGAHGGREEPSHLRAATTGTCSTATADLLAAPSS